MPLLRHPYNLFPIAVAFPGQAGFLFKKGKAAKDNHKKFELLIPTEPSILRIRGETYTPPRTSKEDLKKQTSPPLSGVIRANRFARFARIGWFARIGNSNDSGESAWRAIKIGVWIANELRESRCESPVPLSSSKSRKQPKPVGIMLGVEPVIQKACCLQCCSFKIISGSWSRFPETH